MLSLWRRATACGLSPARFALSVASSPWLLSGVFSLLFGFALLKRCAELISYRGNNLTVGRVRGHAIEKIGRTALYGCLSSYLALLAFGVYLLTDPDHHLRYDSIWVFYVLLAYWITRMWLMAQSSVIKSDPISFALRGRPSRFVGVLMALSVLVAG